MSEDQPISANLSEYREAMEQELRVSPLSTSDELAKTARERLFAVLPEASEELVHIIRVGSKDDAVRFQAIKFVFEQTLGKPSTNNPKEDDVDKIIKTLLAST